MTDQEEREGGFATETFEASKIESENQVTTMTPSQQRRAARLSKRSSKPKRRKSRDVNTITQGGDENFEEEYQQSISQEKDGGPRVKKRVETDRTGFIPPTQMSGSRSTEKSLEKKKRLSGYVAPSHVATARPSDKRDKSGFTPPTQMSGSRSTDKAVERKNRSSGFVAPTHVRTPRSSEKSTARKGEGKDKRSETSKGSESDDEEEREEKQADEQKSQADDDEDLEVEVPAASAPSVSQSGYVPPTHVKGPRSADKSIRGKNKSFEGRRQSEASGFVPPTRVDGARSADKRLDRKKKQETTGATGGFVPPTHVSGSRSNDKDIDGKSTKGRTSLQRGPHESGSHGSLDPDASTSLRALKVRDKITPPSTSVPPVARSVDILPSGYSSDQPSNIEIDAASVSIFSSITGHSAATARVRNLSLTDGSSSASSQLQGRSTSLAYTGNVHELEVRSSSVASESQDTLSPPAERRASSGVRPSRPMRMMIDEQGHTMSKEELRELWERSGKCVECGVVQTHKKAKYGPFGVLRRMIPLTVEGHAYRGYCLRCHAVPDLRRILDDPNIPLDLPRADPSNDSLRSLHTRDEEAMEHAFKRSPLAKMCGSVRFQAFLVCTILGVVSALVAVGLLATKGAEPFVPPTPTSAPSGAPSTFLPTQSPTAYEWAVVAEIRNDEIQSFGYRVMLSSDGLTLAVSSPLHSGSRGRLDIYRNFDQSVDWIKIGDAVAGKEPGEELGFGLSLSGDGSTVAVGSPGIDEGSLQIFRIDPQTGLVQKGQTLLGLTPSSQFGYSVALAFDGNRVFVSAPQYAETVETMYGMVQAFDFDGQQWIQVGNDMIGSSHGIRFGHSIAADEPGDRVAVGAPLDDEKWEDAGQIRWYELSESGEWIDFLNNQLAGSEANSMLGTRVSTNSDGVVLMTGSRDGLAEEYPNAGTVSIWGLDKTFNDANQIGFPISGSFENARFGYDLAIGKSGELVIISGENVNGKAGSVRVFILDLGNYEPYGQELFGPPLGAKEWFGKGPSVSVAARSLRVAVGYENVVLDDGTSHPVVRIHDYFISQV